MSYSSVVQHTSQYVKASLFCSQSIRILSDFADPLCCDFLNESLYSVMFFSAQENIINILL